MADRLNVAVEGVRMAYGQSTGMRPDQLKKVFSDALRWQLQRILEDQAGTTAPSDHHASINSLYAEAWGFLGRRGVGAQWTLDEHDRLIAAGWSPARAKQVADLVFEFQNNDPVSKTQIDNYVTAFGIMPTQDNVARMGKTICAARAAACREATALLPDTEDETAAWVDDALADDGPFAFEQIAPQGTRPAPTEPLSDDIVTPAQPPAPSSKPERPKQCIVDAAEDCIAAYSKEGGWDTDSIKQVRTAIRLFDHACGGDAFIEDLDQSHVRAFTTLCRALPNRWGRTREEQAGGIAASLKRAEGMDPAQIGISQVTINKHLTWVAAVLAHAAGEEDDPEAHRPDKPLSFKVARAGLGKSDRKQRKRDRDKRANWTKQEVATLLSAPIWTGCADIGGRFKPGTEIFHDAWYWLPLMLPLYGGRSSRACRAGLGRGVRTRPDPLFSDPIYRGSVAQEHPVDSTAADPSRTDPLGLYRLCEGDARRRIDHAVSRDAVAELHDIRRDVLQVRVQAVAGLGFPRRHVMAASRRRGMEGQGRPQLPRLGNDDHERACSQRSAVRHLRPRGRDGDRKDL
ncbi:MAG TPA: hypothetical protein H9899_13790 [Candidatus Sphingomonas excrementigallinarum]|nr:hypothetical protein [Candidatus Sphingomonas excrementigallinarum]